MSEKIEPGTSKGMREVILLRAEQNYQRQLDWIGRYNSRSATILGIAIAMLGFLATEAPPPHKWEIHCFLAAIAAAVPLAVCLQKIYSGQYPNTNSPNKSLVYFGTIAKFKFDDFVAKCKEQSDEQYFSDLCYQTHINSSLMAKKFTALKLALRWLLIAVPFWSIAIIWFRILKS